MTEKKYYISWDIGIKNLAFAIFTNDELIYWKNISITNKKKISKNEIPIMLKNTLDKYKNKILKYNYECAIIESQIKKNIKAGWLFSALSMWLYCNLIKKIIPITAKKKFEVLGIEIPKKYYERKQIIIKKCNEIIKSKNIITNDKCIKRFEKYIKKDDISDAFIMGYCYLKSL